MVERPTLTDAPGVRVLLPADLVQGGRGELNTPATARPVLGRAVKTVKPRDLSPAVLHNQRMVDDF